MSHLDICSTSYGKKKGQPLKVGNRFDPGVCRWGVTHRWKTLKGSYKFALDLIPVGGLRKKLRACKISGVQTRTILGLLLGNPETKSHSDVGAVGKCKEYCIEEGGGFTEFRL